MKYDRNYLQHEFRTYNTVNPWVGAWTIARMRQAIDAHDQGEFYYSSAASVKITQFSPIFGALRQRIEPPVGFPLLVKGGIRGLDRIVRDEVEAQFSDESDSFPSWLLGDIYKALALMGFVWLQHTYKPSAYGSILEIKTRPWPTSATQWIEHRGIYQALTLEGPIDLVDGDGHWSLVGHGEAPHLNGAVRCLGTEFVEGGHAKRDRNDFSDRYGHPKPIGILPEKMAFGDKSADATVEAVQGLSEPGSGGVFMHGTEVEMLSVEGATASGIFQQILDSNWTNVACALLGSDGTMSKGTGGVYASPTFAGVKLEIVRSDAKAKDRATNRGHIKPYVGVNYADQVKVMPRSETVIPDPERDARTTALAKRHQDLAAIVKVEREVGFDVGQARVDELAAALDVSPPTLAQTSRGRPSYAYDQENGNLTRNEIREELGREPTKDGMGDMTPPQYKAWVAAQASAENKSNPKTPQENT